MLNSSCAEKFSDIKREIVQEIRESENCSDLPVVFSKRYRLNPGKRISEFYHSLHDILPKYKREDHLIGVLPLDKQQPVMSAYLLLKNIITRDKFKNESISRWCDLVSKGSPSTSCTVPITLGESIRMSKFISEDKSIRAFQTGSKFLSTRTYTSNINDYTKITIYDVNEAKGPSYIEISCESHEDLSSCSYPTSISKLFGEEIDNKDNIYYWMWNTLPRK